MMVQKRKMRNVFKRLRTKRAPPRRHRASAHARSKQHAMHQTQHCKRLSRALRTGMTGLDRVVMGDMVNRPSPPS